MLAKKEKTLQSALLSDSESGARHIHPSKAVCVQDGQERGLERELELEPVDAGGGGAAQGRKKL
jgi:hypothetical protein